MPAWETPGAKPKICICLPHTGTVTTYFAMKTMFPLFFVPVPWADKPYMMQLGVPVSVARNSMVDACLKDPTITHILMVDSDMQPEAPDDINACLKILLDASDQFKAPIVSGLYRAKQLHGFNYAAWIAAPPGAPMASHGRPGYVHMTNLLPGDPQYVSGNWFQADVVGMGFCLFRKEVFEKIPRPWFPWDDPAPSEDFNFCAKARAMGIPVNVHAGVRLTHSGNLVVGTAGNIFCAPA